jgi:hypothetical protein
MQYIFFITEVQYNNITLTLLVPDILKCILLLIS